jgi:hypothetical protein
MRIPPLLLDDDFRLMSFDEMRNAYETYGGFHEGFSRLSEEDEDFKAAIVRSYTMEPFP